MKNSIIVIFSVFISFWSCKKNTEETTGYTQATSIETKKEHPGKKLMEINCNVCHSPTASHDSRIAPPMIAVKKHYLNEGITKKEFIKSIQSFMKNPNESDSKMPGAVRRFGVMPKANYPEATITLIAEYIYDYEIEQPEWFEDHFKQGHGKGNGNEEVEGEMKGKQESTSNNANVSFEELGMKYALGTKAELGKNLMGTIQRNGVLEAVKFCNEAAYPITDSMEVVYNAVIKRVSDKPRNLDNLANSKEKYYIRKFQKVIANNQEPQPIIEDNSKMINFYYPITTNNMCLQCHGTNIKPSLYKEIKQLYPDDKAVGYTENEVRGIWSISFNKQ